MKNQRGYIGMDLSAIIPGILIVGIVAGVVIAYVVPFLWSFVWDFLKPVIHNFTS